MIRRSASFTNTDDNITLNVNGNCPGILIEQVDGIYAFKGEVKTSPYSQTNGDRYKSTRAPKRNIVVTGKIFDNFWENRQLMYRVFRLGSVGKFCYTEPDRSNRYADYYVESVDIDQNAFRGQYQISLICPDPFFYAGTPESVDLSAWVNDFTFEHDFLSAGEELGHRESSMIKEIQNLNGVDGIGMKIVLTASANVTNPFIYLVETGERITIGTANNPSRLAALPGWKSKPPPERRTSFRSRTTRRLGSMNTWIRTAASSNWARASTRSATTPTAAWSI